MRYYSNIKFLPFYAVSILPMAVLYVLSDILFNAVYNGIDYRRQVVRDNLQKSFPHKNQLELTHIEKKCRHFCDIAVESIKTLFIDENEIRKRLVVRKPNLIRQHLDGQQNVLLYAAHQGDWRPPIVPPLLFVGEQTSNAEKAMEFYRSVFKNSESGNIP